MSIETPEITTPPARLGLNLDKSTWTRVRFGDVAQASKEKVDPTLGEIERYVAGEHMDSDDLKIHRWGEVGEGYLGPAFHRRFRQGQVLYGSRRTYLRKVAVAEFEGVCANTTFVVESKDNDVLLQEFLPFVMSSESFHRFAIQESKGSVNPYVNWSDIARYEFSLPPLDEQKRLADLLWSLERHRAGISRTQYVLEMASATRFTDLLKRGEEDMSLFADILVGHAFKSIDFEKTPTPQNRPLLRGINIGVGTSRWEPQNTVYWPHLLTDQTRKFVLAEGDVVIPMDRPFTADGRLRWTQLSSKEQGALLVQRVARLRPRSVNLQPVVRAIVTSHHFQRALNISLTGSFAPHLAHGDFVRYKFSLECPEVLAQETVSVEAAFDTLRREKDSTEVLRSALLAEIFEEAD